VQLKERQEMMTQIDAMMVEVLKAYYKNNQNKLPDHIIYYRDGVSEGQFNSVLEEEVERMEMAFDVVTQMTKRPTPYRPKITLIIVQKRHHTRIRPQFSEDARGRMGNVPAGTTVDTTITHPYDFDYFLASHEGIQGTTKPAHYYVIRDDKGLGADELFKITFFLCHTYANCTRSISIPTPVMYAHKTAFRARSYIVAAPLSTITLPRDATDDQIEQERVNRIRELNKLTSVCEPLRTAYFL
jgi:eukaryotic translation initiation factor 2C